MEGYHTALSEVLEQNNEIFCKYEAAKDKERKINDSENYTAIKNLNIEKYVPKGQEKFIKYAAFIDEFKQFILTRPLKPVVKLNHLKTCLGGDALDIVKNYTHGSQLNDALEA